MKKKILIYTIVYNHEKFIEKTLSRIPDAIYENYDCEILVSDDKSSDNTRNVLKQFSSNFEKKAKITICTMRKNQGMGGNQKIGYYYAIKNKFDIVVLLHGDGQYAPEYLPKLLENFNECIILLDSFINEPNSESLLILFKISLKSSIFKVINFRFGNK